MDIYSEIYFVLQDTYFVENEIKITLIVDCKLFISLNMTVSSRSFVIEENPKRTNSLYMTMNVAVNKKYDC